MAAQLVASRVVLGSTELVSKDGVVYNILIWFGMEISLGLL
jgi:hypothetical protein